MHTLTLSLSHLYHQYANVMHAFTALCFDFFHTVVACLSKPALLQLRLVQSNITPILASLHWLLLIIGLILLKALHALYTGMSLRSSEQGPVAVLRSKLKTNRAFLASLAFS